MGSNTLPPCQRVPLDVAQSVGEAPLQGYAYKAFQRIHEAHKAGEALAIEFPSVSAANKQRGHIAYYADRAGFDLYTKRETGSSVLFCWLEAQKKEEGVD